MNDVCGKVFTRELANVAVCFSNPYDNGDVAVTIIIDGVAFFGQKLKTGEEIASWVRKCDNVGIRETEHAL